MDFLRNFEKSFEKAKATFQKLEAPPQSSTTSEQTSAISISTSNGSLASKFLTILIAILIFIAILTSSEKPTGPRPGSDPDAIRYRNRQHLETASKLTDDADLLGWNNDLDKLAEAEKVLEKINLDVEEIDFRTEVESLREKIKGLR